MRCRGVVHEDVDLPQSGNGLGNHPIGVGLAAHVTDRGDATNTEALDLANEIAKSHPAHLRLGLTALVNVARAAGVEVRHHQVGAGCG